MAAVQLPTTPGPRSAVVSMSFWGALLIPPFGGAAQRPERLGTRNAIDVEMPPMKTEPDGRQWVARLKRGMRDRVLFEFPQPSLKIGAPGVPLVKTAVAGGTSVVLKGLTPSYAIREGQYLSFVHGTRHYLHSAQAQAIADASGDVTVTIDPMLRTNLSVNDVVEIATPKIEGYIEGDELAWQLALEHHTGLGFRIVEAE